MFSTLSIVKLFVFAFLLGIFCQITFAQGSFFYNNIITILFSVPCFDDGSCAEAGFDCGNIYLDEVCVGGICNCEPRMFFLKSFF